MKLFHKSYLPLIAILIIVAVAIGYSQISKSSPQTTQEVSVNQKELEGYYQVYKNPSVIFLRKAFNAYLANDGSQVCILQGAVKEDRREGIITGLDAFSRDYYKSKFIVATIDDNQENGKDIQIIFQDKPDRIFYAWVGDNPDGKTCLIGFNSKEYFDPDKVKDLNEVYKRFLLDKEHAL
ncbi:MAG: hypothetical protein HYW63_05115 [Candidatus Levybacteria bacterium]|nr:hypothetical protein [Candidatus Levybacteria bacterium]